MNWFRQTDNSLRRHAAQEEPTKQPWEMSKNDYQKHQNTGWIPSTAYRDYQTSQGLSWLKYERFTDLLETINIKGVPVEIRAETRPNRYVKTDQNGDIVRDQTGDALMMTDDEARNAGLAMTDSTICAFANKAPIGFASDEFGTSGVWVVNDFQKQGLGVRLLEHLHQLNPKLAKNKIGQMTQAGWNMTGAYHKRLVQKALQEGKSVPPEVLQEYPDLAPGKTASNEAEVKVADGLFSRDPVQADPKAVGYKEDWGEHHGPVTYVPDTWNFPKGYHQPPMPLPKKVYHVTPFPNEILKEGFKAFRSNTGKQTFGGHGTYVSFTSLENAKFYQEGLKDMVRIANGMYSWQDAPSLAKKWGVSEEKVPGIVEDVDRWSREGTEPWEDRLKLAHFVKSLSLRGGKFPLFIGVGAELINRLSQVKPEDVAIMEADSSPQEWHTGLGMLAPEEMKGKYTYNEGENEWRVFSPDSIPPQNIRRIANWYRTSMEKTAGLKDKVAKYKITDPFVRMFVAKYENQVGEGWNEIDQAVQSGMTGEQAIQQWIQQGPLQEIISDANPESEESPYFFTPQDIDIETEYRQNMNNPLVQQAYQQYRADPERATNHIISTVNGGKVQSMKPWINYITDQTNTVYVSNPAFQYLMLDGIFKSTEKPSKESPSQLNAEVVSRIFEGIKNGKDMNIGKAYNKELTNAMLQSSGNAVLQNGDGWIRIPSKISDPQNFDANAEKLKELSKGNGWCTAQGMAMPYLSQGDFWMYIKDGRAAVAVRMDSGGRSAIEIRGRGNQTPVEFFDEVDQLFNEKQFSKDNYVFKEMETIKQNTNSYLSDPAFRSTMIQSVMANPHALNQISPKAWDKELRTATLEGWISLIKRSPSSATQAPSFVENAPEFRQAVIFSWTDRMKGGQPIYRWDNVPDYVISDPDFHAAEIKRWRDEIAQNARSYNDLPKRLKDDPEFNTTEFKQFLTIAWLEMSRQRITWTGRIPKMVREHPMFQSQDYQTEMKNGWIRNLQTTNIPANQIRNIPPFLKKDPEFLLAWKNCWIKTIKRRPQTAKYAPPFLKNDPDFKAIELQAWRDYIRGNRDRGYKTPEHIQSDPTVQQTMINQWIRRLRSNPGELGRVPSFIRKLPAFKSNLPLSVQRTNNEVRPPNMIANNWYGSFLQKTAGFFRKSSVTFSIADSHRIAQPMSLFDLCHDFSDFITRNRGELMTETFAPYATDIEPDTSSSGFDSSTGIINFYMRPRRTLPEERRDQAERIQELIRELQEKVQVDDETNEPIRSPENDKLVNRLSMLRSMYSDMFAIDVANDNPQEFIKAIEAWKADKEMEGYKISYNPTPDTSRAYGVPVMRVNVEQNPSIDYPVIPEMNAANFNAAAVLRLLGLFYPDNYTGCCPAADMLQRINAVEQEQMRQEARPGGIIPNDPPDPADAWKNEDQDEGQGKGPTIIDGGLPISQLKGYFVTLRNMCEFAIQNGFKDICWG